MAETLAVRNLAALTKTFKAAPKDYNKAYRAELRTVAKPTQQDAQRLTTERIRRVRFSPDWTKYRVGITQKLVYVAPRKRGVKGRGRDQFRRGANQVAGGLDYGTLAMTRAMEPALQAHHEQIERDFDAMLDRLVTKWDHDGP